MLPLMLMLVADPLAALRPRPAVRVERPDYRHR
jgi:hypothetical protein